MRRPLLAGIAVFVALGAAPSAFADDSALSTRLQELATRDLRDASHADQADAVSLLQSGAGSLSRAHGGLLVEIRLSGSESERADDLTAAGAEIVHVSHEYNTITAAVDESDLRAVATVPGVDYVGEVITPMAGSVDGADGEAGAINTCQTGVVSEGNTQLKADVAKSQFDVDGSGVKVGILSDSYDTKTTATTHAAGDVGTADLPGAGNPCGRTEPVQVLDDSAGAQGDEGRAMVQIVHDIAPGASLAFATAFNGQTAFADNIRALANNGAKIIADDIINFTEPMYQDGIVAKAVNDVTAQGVTYFSMAFNNNGLGVNSYEAPNGYRSMPCPAAVLALEAGGANSCMDFDPGAGTDVGFEVNAAASAPFRLSLSWAEPMSGVTDDFDLYVFNPDTGGAASLEAETDNLASQTPTEFGSFTVVGAGQRQIVIRRYAGTGTPRLKFVSNDNGAQTWQSTQAVTAPDVQGPTIYGHNGADASITVGAVPFNNSNTMETFSGRGPVTSVLAPINGTTPSAAFPAPRVLSKPDVSASDKGITTFFGSGNRFSGTSAATPHAAAVGALQLAANPALTRDQIEAAQKATARPVGAFGPLDMGAGLIDAQAAIASQPPSAPTVTFTSGPTGATDTASPTFTFTVGGHAKTIGCSVDGGVAQACTNSFTPGPLADGPHTAAIAAIDYFGQSGTATQAFTVATTPDTLITKAPKDKIYSKRTKYKFVSNLASATFQCKVDRDRWQACQTGVRVVHIPYGRHKFLVRAVNGNAVDPTPAKDTFKRKHKQGRQL